MGEEFARDGEECDASVVTTGQLVSLPFPEG